MSGCITDVTCLGNKIGLKKATTTNFIVQQSELVFSCSGLCAKVVQGDWQQAPVAGAEETVSES